jgi:RNase adaptor protein for sRNA GlmZ degradation
MAGVQRNEFVQRLADRGGYVVVDQLPSEVQSALSQVGIQPQDLQRIAGSDGVIRGNTEFEALFREIDRRTVGSISS